MTGIVKGGFRNVQDMELVAKAPWTTPFNTLGEKELCPWAGMLEKINAALR